MCRGTHRYTNRKVAVHRVAPTARIFSFPRNDTDARTLSGVHASQCRLYFGVFERTLFCPCRTAAVNTIWRTTLTAANAIDGDLNVTRLVDPEFGMSGSNNATELSPHDRWR